MSRRAFGFSPKDEPEETGSCGGSRFQDPKQVTIESTRTILYVAPGYCIQKGRDLMAQAFDTGVSEKPGSACALAEQVDLLTIGGLGWAMGFFSLPERPPSVHLGRAPVGPISLVGTAQEKARYPGHQWDLGPFFPSHRQATRVALYRETSKCGPV